MVILIYLSVYLWAASRLKGVTVDQEESLLQQLTEITRVMREGQLLESVAPEKKTSVQDDWEGNFRPRLSVMPNHHLQTLIKGGVCQNLDVNQDLQGLRGQRLVRQE